MTRPSKVVTRRVFLTMPENFTHFYTDIDSIGLLIILAELINYLFFRQRDKSVVVYSDEDGVLVDTGKGNISP
jgi:hypothetical protein